MMIESKWDGRFMRLAREVSTWSKDPSAQIGAVIIKDRRILATGYNGFPKGVHDTEDRLHNKEEKYRMVIHGEMNALLNALNSGVSVQGSTIYVYGLPVCVDCAKCIVQSGITRVVIPYPEHATERWRNQWEQSSYPMFKEAGIQITEVDTNTLDYEQISFRIEMNRG